ncbi:MAG: TadE/TadG family type IV pilus assembly protein [Rhizobiaceae bacterium]
MPVFAQLRRFALDRSGQFAILFSLCLIPVLAGIGMAIDYSYLLQAKTRLQDSTDAAALFAASEYRKTGVLPVVGRAENYLLTDFTRAASEAEPTVNRYEIKDGKLYLDTAVRKNNAIMAIFGYKYNDLPANSVVNIGSDQELEIALALDTTYSMTKPSGTSASKLDPTGEYLPPSSDDVDRLTALKVASLKFNNAIFGALNAAATRRISVVPFSRYVNVGTSMRGQPWLDVPSDSASTGKTCSDWYYPVIAYSNKCTPASYFVDGVEVKYQSCEPIYGADKIQSCWPTGASTWHGCVGSRSEPDNLKEGFSGKKFTGLMNTWCGTPLLPLTSDKVAVANRISALSANDYTYIPEGVMWGTRVLTSSQPFVEGRDNAALKKVRKILVLMTDGENQISADLPDYPTHNSNNLAQADDWTTKACNEAKDEGIEVFTVTFGTDVTSSAKDIIRGCASNPANYYDASNAEKLVKAFEDIAAQVNKMYLAG